MHRILERLDAAASSIVPLLYLCGLMLGTAAYFADVTLDAGLAVGLALAIAAECHAFLEQRRLRGTWHLYTRTPRDDRRRESIILELRVHAAILAGLVAFSTFNSVAFVSATWRPASGFLPAWLQIAIRGGIIPALFLASGFLTPLHADPSEQLASASQAMLRRTLKATVRQWRGRLEQARRSGADLAPVAIALLQDAGDVAGARRLELIAQGLASAEQGTAPTIAPAAASSSPEAPAPHTPPTGPGTPLPAHASKRRTAERKRPQVVALARPGHTAEQRIRALLAQDPAMSVRQIAQQARVSESTASKYRRLVASEQAGQVAL